MSVIAAVYARKSTDQLGLTDEQKSVTRQVEHTRAYAVRKGWPFRMSACSWSMPCPAPSSRPVPVSFASRER